MRTRKRVTPRFYVFLAIVALVAFLFLRPHLNFGVKDDVVLQWTHAVSQAVDCVIIRDESVFSSDSTARVEFLAVENTEVEVGSPVANLFATGYSENLLSRLEETRQSIQTYHKTLLGTIVDNDLERLDTIIDMTALEFKNLVTQQSRGNLQNVTEQLETAMVNRQDYLRQNKRDDTKLTKLYDEENARLGGIQSWRKVATAQQSGVLSFYLDGYEQDLTVSLLESLTAADIQTVLRGGSLAHMQDTLDNGIYRIVNQDRWYVAIAADATVWNPVNDQNYYFQLEGFEDLMYTAVVTSVQKSGGMVVAILQVDQPIGPLIYQRAGHATLSTSLSSLAVRTDMLYNNNGQLGVWLHDVPGGTFIPVEVLSTDIQNDIALIQPLVSGALKLGDRVLMK